MPPEDQLDGLGEDEYAKIVFVNREEGWVYIEHVDDADKVYGKLCDYMRSVVLHKNQRVWFVKDRIAGVHIVTMQEPIVISSCLFLVAVISEVVPEQLSMFSDICAHQGCCLVIVSLISF